MAINFWNNTRLDLGRSRYRYALHFCFWSCIFLYEVIIWGLVDGKYEEKFISTSIELPVKITAAYFTLYVLIDRLLLRKRYLAFALYLIASMFIVGLILRGLSFYVLYPRFYVEGLQIPLFYFPKILIAIFYAYAWVAILATFHLMRRYYTNQQITQSYQQAAEQLEKEKLEAELKLLKSQINPHFLFNSLNSLYVLALNNSQRTPAMIHKLSELMSYMLYDSNQPEVLLEKEIEYIRNYIALEKIRYGDRIEITFNVYNQYEDLSIAPLLMLPFIENSFKHGVRNQLSNAWVFIELDIVDEEVVFKVENSKGPKETERQGGIGLNNVMKRLDYLYPNRYSLTIFDEQDTYMVVLRIGLNGKKFQTHVTEPELNSTHL